MSDQVSPPRQQFVITVLARDRVGIIAEVARAISALEGDIADLRESVLRGYLNMMLLATFPAAQPPEAIRRRLLALSTQGAAPLDIVVHPADDALPATSSDIPPEAFVITATGQDRIGFVASVAEFCARHQINILDLSTAVAEGAYTMILLVDLARAAEPAQVRRWLQAFGQETGLRLMLQHYAIFKATNEVSLL